MLAPRALVLRGPGTNCDHETAHAFERAGGVSRRLQVQALAARPALLDDFQIFCIPGGFSYGDDIASGRILAVELAARLGDALQRFHDRGGLILGICNGFQVLLQTGLLLAPDEAGRPRATLAPNTSGRFVDCWVHLQSQAAGCPFLEGLSRFELPVAHAEGRFVTADEPALEAFDQAGQLVLRYAADAAGTPTNPNGSTRDIAGVCDPTGRILGLMPHPERVIEATQHPAWVGRLDPSDEGAGLAVFRNAIRAAGGDAA